VASLVITSNKKWCGALRRTTSHHFLLRAFKFALWRYANWFSTEKRGVCTPFPVLNQLAQMYGYVAWLWLGGASPPKPPDWRDGCPSPQTPLGKETLHALCRGFEADPNLSTPLCKLIQYRSGRCIAPPTPVLNQLAQSYIA